MQLISYRSPKLLTFPPEVSTASLYGLIRSGVRVGMGQNCDITGNQGMGRGARVMRDELGTFTLTTSPGRGASRLFKVTRTGKGKRARFVRKLTSKRAPGRGAILGHAARSVGVSGIDAELDRAQALDQWLAPAVDRSGFLSEVKRLQAFGAVVFLPSPGAVDICKHMPARTSRSGTDDGFMNA